MRFTGLTSHTEHFTCARQKEGRKGDRGCKRDHRILFRLSASLTSLVYGPGFARIDKHSGGQPPKAA